VAVFLSPGDLAPAVASRRVAAGRLRRIGRGVVTDDLDGGLEEIVADHLYEIIARLIPGAVVTDRSALVGGPLEAGETRVLYIAHPERRRDLRLPGHVVSVRSGSGPVEGDQPFHHDDLHLASQARALVDNARISRTTADGLARTLSAEELEGRIDRLAAQYGPERFARLRRDVERVGEAIGEKKLAQQVSELMGAAQGTRPDLPVRTSALSARRDGAPADQERVALFDRLFETLRDRAPEPRNTTDHGASRRAVLPFFEAYFSNFIEGTEFEIEEAAAIVYEGEIPAARPRDAHDVLGTYRIVADEQLMASPPGTGEELLTTLRGHHTAIMQQRPETNPGVFKRQPNRAGSSVFVRPTEVVGTLQAGWERVRKLDDPFARAILAMCVVAEVHPFDAGNGRVARIMMNTELVAAAQARIVIPTVYRNNYLSALRALTANARPDALVATLAFAQRWTSLIDWSTLASARGDLERTNALLDPAEAEQEGLRLVLPVR
jgi:hypothetical protein